MIQNKVAFRFDEWIRVWLENDALLWNFRVLKIRFPDCMQRQNRTSYRMYNVFGNVVRKRKIRHIQSLSICVCTWKWLLRRRIFIQFKHLQKSNQQRKERKKKSRIQVCFNEFLLNSFRYSYCVEIKPKPYRMYCSCALEWPMPWYQRNPKYFSHKWKLSAHSVFIWSVFSIALLFLLSCWKVLLFGRVWQHQLWCCDCVHQRPATSESECMHCNCESSKIRHDKKKSTNRRINCNSLLFFRVENGPIIQVLAYVQVFPFHEHN